MRNLPPETVAVYRKFGLFGFGDAPITDDLERGRPLTLRERDCPRTVGRFRLETPLEVTSQDAGRDCRRSREAASSIERCKMTAKIIPAKFGYEKQVDDRLERAFELRRDIGFLIDDLLAELPRRERMRVLAMTKEETRAEIQDYIVRLEADLEPHPRLHLVEGDDAS
jgi:hypothetical protein